MSYMNGTSMLDEMLNQMSDDNPGIAFDLGRDEPGMTLQRLEDREWVDYVKDGEVIKSPVKIDKLPAGKYRLV